MKTFYDCFNDGGFFMSVVYKFLNLASGFLLRNNFLANFVDDQN